MISLHNKYSLTVQLPGVHEESFKEIGGSESLASPMN